ncbi:uncharacterized protein NEMAJ01_0307 [Nematocida major]|uniref:uncharacterized protein n=1 Tax=Nematocida major TaxID=1912982 RepID=UPI0020072C3D|nr:uncharacterized protein NEMAJ01_0307 [Nematocida major]KAH9385411.1 hypothetical protein NEMAJ01_0307 [Nematocida major]
MPARVFDIKKMKSEREKILTHAEVKGLMEACLQGSLSTQAQTMKYAVHSVVNRPSAPAELKEKLTSFGITEFEAVQLLNAPPKKVLDLYVVVEELEERLTEEAVGEILSILSSYAE